MSETAIPEVREDEELETTDDGKYCHIVDSSGLQSYCGRTQLGDLTCKPYNGEAICPSCGLATCPECAVLCSLNERLEEM
jgi:hypothetical protein